MINILAIGKKHEPWIAPGIKRYEQRLRSPWNTIWQLLPHSTAQGERARLEESERIITKLQSTDFVIVLDERGEQLNSPALSRTFERALSHGRTPTLIIGGAYGVTDQLRQHADLVWSLSPLVFPHQLVRLIVVEQIYRAQEINLGHPYHHN